MNEEGRPDLSTYYVDEAGDGVLFGPNGRNRLNDLGSPKFFMLGMVRCAEDRAVEELLSKLRYELMGNPLYASIHTMKPEVGKTAKFFHAKDDHAEIRSKVFELLVRMDFKFYAVIKDMRKVLQYVQSRNSMDSTYRYKPNELYDLTVRMLFKNRLHKEGHVRIAFARRGKADRTAALTQQLETTRQRFLEQHKLDANPILEITPAYPWEAPGLQLADYCLWALQRCYERHEARFLHAIWSKVSLIHDHDDPAVANYGTYWTRKKSPPDPNQIKNRRI
ncbi:hypothetical protein EC9_49640 [Rosistilla ulvae]|uniref:DUF3800 domain-containing protein n=1 Tax=Rosistilla ulvae TaxID=1930277 RepID=A0A517M784_9BACT|nr:DUF3800 domain-containing protein [Rosistilla ulvae]QDS90748.1 hypothetical protein EC9_49640 [Rosistilla ulvae]